MTNPTTQEGEDFETIVGDLTKAKPGEQVDTRPTGAYPKDLPNPNAQAPTTPARKPAEHHQVDTRPTGAYPKDLPNPTAQADDETSGVDPDGAYPKDNETH